MNAVLSRNVSRLVRARPAQPQSAWANGDYAVVGNALQVVSEELCETVNLCQDDRVLDVAAGNFHASLAAARRWCDVTAANYAPEVHSRTASRAEAEAVGVCFIERDAEALPFGDQSFQSVVSAFGAMFAADQERAASEMIRVVQRGRRIGLANWTPQGFIGQLSAMVARHGAVTAHASTHHSPFEWGTTERLEELFGAYGSVWSTRKCVSLRSSTPMDWVDKLRAGYLPALKTFALRAELLELVERFNRADDGSMVVEAEYLEVVITRR